MAEPTNERERLWLGHGCSTAILYGDDGEMQCARCMIDFRRDSFETIAERLASTAKVREQEAARLREEVAEAQRERDEARKSRLIMEMSENTAYREALAAERARADTAERHRDRYKRQYNESTAKWVAALNRADTAERALGVVQKQRDDLTALVADLERRLHAAGIGKGEG